MVSIAIVIICAYRYTVLEYHGTRISHRHTRYAYRINRGSLSIINACATWINLVLLINAHIFPRFFPRPLHSSWVFGVSACLRFSLSGSVSSGSTNRTYTLTIITRWSFPCTPSTDSPVLLPQLFHWDPGQICTGSIDNSLKMEVSALALAPPRVPPHASGCACDWACPARVCCGSDARCCSLSWQSCSRQSRPSRPQSQLCRFPAPNRSWKEAPRRATWRFI